MGKSTRASLKDSIESFQLSSHGFVVCSNKQITHQWEYQIRKMQILFNRISFRLTAMTSNISFNVVSIFVSILLANSVSTKLCNRCVSSLSILKYRIYVSDSTHQLLTFIINKNITDPSQCSLERKKKLKAKSILDYPSRLLIIHTRHMQTFS